MPELGEPWDREISGVTHRFLPIYGTLDDEDVVSSRPDVEHTEFYHSFVGKLRGMREDDVRIGLDLRGLNYMSSGSFGLLRDIYFLSGEQPVPIYGVREKVRQTLDMAYMHTIVEYIDQEAERQESRKS